MNIKTNFNFQSKLLATVALVFFISHFSSFISPKAFAAEQSLRVSPVIINVTLSPGKTITHEVTIENLTNVPMPLRASLNDFLTTGEEGGYVFEETRDNPLLQWIKLSETDFLLNPKEKKTVLMTITTPKSIPLGGYYGILFFEPVNPSANTNTTRVSSKVGVLMLANVGVPDPNAPKAEIVNFAPNIINQDGTVPLLLRVKNISLNFFTAKPILTVSSIIPNGKQPQEITLEDKTIFPGKIRRWTEDNTLQDLSPNIYKAQMNVSTGNGQYLTAIKYFVVFPFLNAAIAILVLAAAIFAYTRRKKLTRAFKAFIE